MIHANRFARIARATKSLKKVSKKQVTSVGNRQSSTILLECVILKHGTCLPKIAVVSLEVFKTLAICQARKKEHKPKLLSPDHMKGWGPKSSVCPSKPGKSDFLGGTSRDFAGISRRCPKGLRKKHCVQFLAPSNTPHISRYDVGVSQLKDRILDMHPPSTATAVFLRQHGQRTEKLRQNTR